jgi:hypothetical protein
MSLKTDLRDKIKRRLGWPTIKLELSDETIDEHIDYSRDKFIKFAAGHATQEVFFTMMLSGGQYLYDMPPGTVNVINYDMSGASLGGINTLFTISHMMYEQGMFDELLHPSGTGRFDLVSLHIARQFLETIQRYMVDPYNFKYHRFSNQLEIQPPPERGAYSITLDDGITYDSPGWILVRTYMIEGSTLPSYQGIGDDDFPMLYSRWIEDFATAKSRETLGLIRRKFAGWRSMGSEGTSMDGNELVQEAKAEIEILLKQLQTEESWEGGAIIVG